MASILLILTLVARAPLEIVLLGDGFRDGPPTALTAGAREILIADIAALSNSTLLVLPNAAGFPASAVEPLMAYLDRGGHIVAFGGAPFTEFVYATTGGDWLNQSELLSSVPPRHELVDWSSLDIPRLARGSGSAANTVSYEALKPGLRATIAFAPPISWETIEFPVQAPPPPDHNVLLIDAAGFDKAESLLIEIRENDGSRWMAVAPLTDREHTIGIHRDAFVYWHDASTTGRGGAADRVRFDQAAAIVTGLASSHQPLTQGIYRYVLRGVRTGELDAEIDTPAIPTLEGFSPAYKLFNASPVDYTLLGAFKGLRLEIPEQIVSPIARPMIPHERRDYTWQPLIKGHNAQGDWNATAAATTWAANGATWTYVGYLPSAADAARMIEALAQSIPEGLVAPGTGDLIEDIGTGACITVRGGEFRDGPRGWFAHGINFWPLYVSGMEPPEYFSHWLEPDTYIPELVEMDLRTLEAMGINLVSIQYGKVSQAPQLRDFIARCGAHGVKANIFLAEAHPTSPSASDDLSQRAFLDLLRAADLEGSPHVFGYDLAWEPVLGKFDARRQFDPLWKEWIEENYGSLEHAETVWGVAVPRDQNRVAGPSDEQLATDGAHTPMVAAYRRFVCELISRRYREVIRLARTVDASHLFGARTGYGGTGMRVVLANLQYPLSAGAAHLDFVSPEGWGYGPANIDAAAFVSQFARWAGNGKPVFWSEFGLHVWEGDADVLEGQREMYAAFAGMVERTRANGWAGWWYPGGYRVDEKSDYGIVAPDRSLRPAAQFLAESAAKLKSGEGATLPGKSIVVDPSSTALELAGLLERHLAEFAIDYDAGGLPTIVTAGTGTSSVDCPFLDVSGKPFVAPAAPLFLNAELVLTTGADGSTAIEMINTGEATIAKSDCWLAISSHESVQSEPRRIGLSSDLERFARIRINLDGLSNGSLEVHSDRFGRFGERLEIVK